MIGRKVSSTVNCAFHFVFQISANDGGVCGRFDVDRVRHFLSISYEFWWKDISGDDCSSHVRPAVCQKICHSKFMPDRPFRKFRASIYWVEYSRSNKLTALLLTPLFKTSLLKYPCLKHICLNSPDIDSIATYKHP